MDKQSAFEPLTDEELAVWIEGWNTPDAIRLRAKARGHGETSTPGAAEGVTTRLLATAKRLQSERDHYRERAERAEKLLSRLFDEATNPDYDYQWARGDYKELHAEIAAFLYPQPKEQPND